MSKKRIPELLKNIFRNGESIQEAENKIDAERNKIDTFNDHTKDARQSIRIALNPHNEPMNVMVDGDLYEVRPDSTTEDDIIIQKKTYLK